MNYIMPKIKSPQTRASPFLVFFLLYYEIICLIYCGQNGWIYWYSAMLCFKQLFHIGVWTFAQFVRLLLATILCVWEILPCSSNRVYKYHIFHWLAKKSTSPHWFWSPPLTRNQRLLFCFGLRCIGLFWKTASKRRLTLFVLLP